MCDFRLFICVDPSLGRLDYNLLSDQALMEMLFDGFDDQTKERFQDDHGIYLDVCEWSCVKCDEFGRVVEIQEREAHVGSLQFHFAPPKVIIQNRELGHTDGIRMTAESDLNHISVMVVVGFHLTLYNVCW